MTDTNSDIYEIRRANMRELIRHFGGGRPLALQLGMANSSFVSHLAGPNPTRIVTEKTARRIETQLGLVPYWLDRENPDTVAFTSQLRLISPLELSAPTSIATPDEFDDISRADEVNKNNDEVEKTHAKSNQYTIDSHRLNECLEKVLTKSSGLTPKQLSKITTVLYSSAQNGDQLDAMIDSLIDLMGL